jgi:hypothetical protein
MTIVPYRRPRPRGERFAGALAGVVPRALVWWGGVGLGLMVG